MPNPDPSSVDLRYGLNCIVTSVKSPKEVNLRFVIERKQYTVTYIERKKQFDEKNLSLLLKGSEAVKASIWNVPFGPPGSDKRSWYVTDVWTPHVEGMGKKRIPEPTISIVCKIAYNLGKEFVVCDLGKYFVRDVIVLPRTAINSAPSTANYEADIGDYLLIFALIIWETQGDEQKARLIPLWAYWDASNRTQNCIVHLNIVESGPEHSSLIIPEQIPCMWGVVQNVFKKTMKVYIPTICSSISVPFAVIYQYNDSCILEGDWLQLWLTPKIKGQMYNHISEVTNWVCSSCCWFGSRCKKVYESYLEVRLKSGYFKHGVLSSDGGRLSSAAAANTKPSKANSKTQVNSSVGDNQLESIAVGTGKVKAIKDKSGMLLVNTSEYVFHLGLMSVYGVKMSKVKNVKIKDLVDVGSDLRYALNTKTDGLKAVWIGPQVVTFKHLHFMPLLTEWIRKRKLDSAIVKEMMKEITDNYEAVNKNKEKESNATKQVVNPKKDTTANKEKKSSNAGKLSANSNHPSQSSLISEEESSLENEVVSSFTNLNVDSENLDCSYCPEEIASCPSYTKEEEDELEKLWWSEDSEESEDELRPIMKPNAASDNADKDSTEGSQASNAGIPADSSGEIGKISPVSETEKSSSSSKSQFIGGNLVEKDPSSLFSFQSGSFTSLAQLSTEGIRKGTETSNLCKTGLVTHKATSDGSVESLSKRQSKDPKSAPTLLILMELTKFLLEKGKAKSISEAGEISAEFIAQLECAMSKTTDFDTGVTYSSVTTQTEVTGPIWSLCSNLEESENLSTSCKDKISNLNLVD